MRIVGASPVAVVSGTSVLQMLELYLGLGAILLIGASFVRPALTVFVLGLLLPIDYLQGVPTVALDGLRYALIAIIVVRVRRSGGLPLPILIAGGSLIGIGVYCFVSGTASGVQSLSIFGVVAMLSGLIGMMMASRNALHLPLLLGFLVGATASATDVVLQSLGLPYLGTPSIYGIEYSGFSEKRTHLAPILAIAAILYVTPYLWRGRRSLTYLGLRFFGLCVTIVALVLSGGRAGFIGLGAALVLWAMLNVKRDPLPVLSVAMAGAVVVYLQRDSHLFLRLFEDGIGESGRASRNFAALRAYLSAPILGPDPTSDIARDGSNAHFPVLVFGLNAGVLGVVGALLLMGVLALAVLRGTRQSTLHQHAPLIALIMCITSLVEPVAFFIGAGRSVLLFVVLAGCYLGTSVPDSQSDHVRAMAFKEKVVGRKCPSS